MYRTIMKILQPENMLEMHKLLVSPRVTVDADWEGIGDSGAPADWEDLRDEDLNSLGFKRSETTQIEFDENETEA